MKLTQEEMIKIFLEKSTSIKKYNKQGSVLARKAVTGEEIITEINGIIETKNNAKDNDVLVQGLKGEQYLIGGAKFNSRYQVNEPLTERLQEYQATGSCFAYEYQGDSMEFMAAWNELMIVNSGDYLASPDDTYNEVYRIEKDAFSKTYKID